MKRILIIQTAFIGDVILATPVIERLRRCFPEADIDFLLRKGNEGLFVGHPHLRRVLIRDKVGDGKIGSLRKVLRKVRGERYDLVVNLHRFLSSGIVAGFSRAGQVCGFDKNPLAWRYDCKVPHVISQDMGAVVHEVDRNLSVVAHLTEGPPDVMRLYPSKADFVAVKQRGRYFCLAPTSVWFTKQWPAERWVTLIGKLDAEAKVFLLGAPGDRVACDAIAEAANHPQVEVLAGTLTLLQSAALMQGAVMNYVNDSAPQHLASAMNAPVRAVFLSTVPAFGFGPRSADSKVVEAGLDLDCRPCGLHGFRACPKGHFRCAEFDVLPEVR
ncbi:MAG TPA: glycosyltransferase family 9 protein [Bacteroidetes bacterium]|nr:glycosyltransferase family 9 protein [Bacteroidota bacterium]